MDVLSQEQIELDEYLGPDETVHCRTAEVTKGRGVNMVPGTLACTNKRLVFVEEKQHAGEQVIDIDIGSIEEIVYCPANIPWSTLLILFMTLILAIFIPSGAEPVALLPAPVRTVAPFFLLGGAMFVALAIWNALGPRLGIKTSHGTHWFHKGELAPFPNAIRGQ